LQIARLRGLYYSIILIEFISLLVKTLKKMLFLEKMSFVFGLFRDLNGKALTMYVFL